MPTSETVDGLEESTPLRRRSSENESIWTKELLPSPPPRKAVATRGPISCPFCGFLTVDDAKLLGQRILCPKCHANFRAPDSRAEQKRAAAGYAVLKYISG